MTKDTMMRVVSFNKMSSHPSLRLAETIADDILAAAISVTGAAMVSKNSCNSEGCNGDYTCINPNESPGAKDALMTPKAGK